MYLGQLRALDKARKKLDTADCSFSEKTKLENYVRLGARETKLE